MANDPTPGGRPYAEPACKTEQVKRCGAKTRKGAPCRHAAGYKTEHLGSGRCWRHGGRGGGTKGNGNSITHGLKVSALRPSTYPHAAEIRAAVDAAFNGQSDLWWARDLLRSQIQNCYDRMHMLEDLRDAESNPSEAFLRALEEQYGRWFTRAATLTAQLPRIMGEIKKLGLEEKDKTYALLVVPPKDMDFVPFRPGTVPVDSRDSFLRVVAEKFAEEDTGDEAGDDAD